MKVNCGRFQATSYDGREIEIRYLSRDELRNLDLSQWDHAHAAPLGVFAFRRADGRHISRTLSSCGLGHVAWSVVHLCQLEAGLFLTPAEIAEGTGIESLRENETLAGRLSVIRRAHEENGQDPRLFLSQRTPYGMAWNPSATWIWLQRLSQKNGDDSQDAAPSQ